MRYLPLISADSNSIFDSLDEKPCKRSKGSPCPPAALPIPPAPPPPPPLVAAPVIPQNETPTKFWTLVEPFCAEITSTDTKFVEESIKGIEQDNEWKTLSENWAVEDMQLSGDETAKDASGSDGAKSESTSDVSSAAKSTAIQRAEIVDFENSDFGLGPVTSLLVGALVSAENSAESAADALLHGGDSVAGDSSISPNLLAKNLGLGNMQQLEKRIKKELFDLGIWEEGDDGKAEISASPTKQSTTSSAKNDADEGVDEVVREMRRIQAELTELSEQNLNSLNSLLKKAQDEMAKQELRKKLGHVDNEVMECYRKMQDCHHKKRQIP